MVTLMTPENIIIHHSSTKDSGTVSWQAIRRFHMTDCAWEAIGYHFGIESIQDMPWAMPHYEILFGRLPDQPGAHTKGRNHDSLGICCVGNFDSVSPLQEQWDLCLGLVRWLMAVYGIPRERVYGHRDFANKTCPGTYWDMEKFRNEL